MKIVYGPVDSWRLDRSLGVDLLSDSGRRCSFDCTYCQISDIEELTSVRRDYVDLVDMEKELVDALIKVGNYTDYITLSGMGEPTLAGNISEAVDLIDELSDKQKAVLTNGSLFHLAEVREALKKLDYVIAELDAPDPDIFKKINKPVAGISFGDMIEGYRRFAEEFEGRFALEMMFTGNNIDHAESMADIVEEVGADEVQINTPLRPSPISPITEEDLGCVEDKFSDEISVLNVYKVEKKKTDHLEDKEVIKRGRPIK